MAKLIPTDEEVAIALARMEACNPGVDYQAKIKEAIEKDGYKHEKCPKCLTTFLACIHFIRCAADDCPMKDQKDKRSMLEHIFGEKKGEQAE